MKKVESKEITVTKDVVTATICDNCGKESTEEDPLGWHEFSTSHNGWGGDSIDSVEYFDVCSGKCFFEIAKRQIQKNNEYKGAEIDGMSLEFCKSLVEGV